MSDKEHPFTKREMEVLQLIADGGIYSEVGGMLKIRKGTVEFHVINAIRKVNARNAVHLIAECIRKEWLY